MTADAALDHPLAVLPLIATAGVGPTANIGSCVVIAVAKKRAIALSASHVIDHVIKSNDISWMSDLKVDPAFRKPRYGEKFGYGNANEAPNLGTIFAVMPGEKCVAPVLMANKFGGNELDIICLRLEIPLQFNAEFSARYALRSRGPQVGETVRIVGYPKGNSFDIEGEPAALQFKIGMLRTAYKGVVTRTFGWNEDYFVRSPGFEINIPSASGCSGGAVLTARDDGTDCLVGITSVSDDTVTKAVTIWPALGLNHGIPHSGINPPDTLLRMLREWPHAITDYDNAGHYVKLHPENADVSVEKYITWE